jgi:hypothetical protein
MRTIPSAVLGEYLADVERFWDSTKPSAFGQDVNRITSKSLLARNLNRLYGKEVALDYLRWLLNRAKRQRETEAKAAWQRERETWRQQRAEAAKVEEPKPKRTDAAYNERRMRDALLAKVRASGWVKAGIRELAREAGMPHRTARDVLDRMATAGQVELDRKWGQGKETGVHPLLDHPAWSGHKHAQLRV